MTSQNYHTADQSRYVGVAGSNMAQSYLRYKEELDRQRREREAAEKKAKGGWWKRALVNGIGGAIQGGISGGIGGAVAGGIGGAGVSALGDAAGMNAPSYGMGGANLGGSAGLAYKRWASGNNQHAESAPSSPMAGYQVPPPPAAPPPPTGFSQGPTGGGYGDPMDNWDMFDQRRNRGY